MDAAVGKLLKYLDDNGLRDNTFVFFTSDNGPETSEPLQESLSLLWLARPLAGHETAHHRSGLPRARNHPLAGPHQARRGQQPNRCAASTCCQPFCAIAGVKPPEGRTLDGADISPIFAGKAVERPHPLYWQYDFAIS